MTPTTKQNLAGIFALLSIVAVILAVVLLAADAYPQGITGGSTVDRTARATANTASNLAAAAQSSAAASVTSVVYEATNTVYVANRIAHIGTNDFTGGGGGLTNGAAIFPVSITLTNPTAGTSETVSNWIDVLRFTMPVASFVTTGTSITNGGSVTFTDISSGVITNRTWDFGDGSTTQLVNAAAISHTYTNGASTNTVSLTTFGEYRTDTKTSSNLVVVAAPLAGNSLVFDGIQNYLVVTNDSRLFPQSGFTVEVWVRFANTPSGNWFVDAYDIGDTLQGYGLTVAEGAFQCFTRNENDYWQPTGTTPVETNTWYHVAMCHDGTTGMLFVNGSLEASDTNNYGPPGAGNSNLYLGWMHWGGYEACQISELRISDSVRYTNTFTPSMSWEVDSNTVALLNFSNVSGTNALDSTGNHNGVLQGSPLPTWSADHP